MGMKVERRGWYRQELLVKKFQTEVRNCIQQTDYQSTHIPTEARYFPPEEIPLDGGRKLGLDKTRLRTQARVDRPAPTAEVGPRLPKHTKSSSVRGEGRNRKEAPGSTYVEEQGREEYNSERESSGEEKSEHEGEKSDEEEAPEDEFEVDSIMVRDSD